MLDHFVFAKIHAPLSLSFSFENRIDQVLHSNQYRSVQVARWKWPSNFSRVEVNQSPGSDFDLAKMDSSPVRSWNVLSLPQPTCCSEKYNARTVKLLPTFWGSISRQPSSSFFSSALKKEFDVPFYQPLKKNVYVHVFVFWHTYKDRMFDESSTINTWHWPIINFKIANRKRWRDTCCIKLNLDSHHGSMLATTHIFRFVLVCDEGGGKN